MAIQKRARLKTYFEVGDTPTQRDFEDLLDSALIKGEDGISFAQDDRGTRLGLNADVTKHPITVAAADNGIQIQSDGAHRPQLELNSGGKTTVLISATPDYGSIGTPANPDQFISFRNGKVGINNINPATTLDVAGNIKFAKGVTADEITNTLPAASTSFASATALATAKAIQDYVENMFIGMISPFASSTPPTGWLECNGQSLDINTFIKLYNRIGLTYGAGVFVNSFRLPDLRGEFIRGWDHGRNADVGRIFGSFQSEGFRSHKHDIYTRQDDWNVSGGAGRPSWGADNGVYGKHITESETQYTGDGETRPRNIALMYCIKY